MHTKMINISAQITREMYDKIDNICKEEDRSKSYIFKKALDYFLTHKSEQGAENKEKSNAFTSTIEAEKDKERRKQEALKALKELASLRIKSDKTAVEMIRELRDGRTEYLCNVNSKS